MLEDGDLLYYEYPNGCTMIICYSKEYDGSIYIESLNKYYCLSKVIRNGIVVYKRS